MTTGNETQAAAVNDRATAGARRRTAPRADVFETEGAFTLVADMPGVDETSVDVTLNRRVLTIRGQAHWPASRGARAAYAEFEEAEYVRAFQLADAVDASKITASIKDGVLRVSVAKAEPAQRKIPVRAE
jgi:HSP20 family molecular chaperone IbpA